MTAVRLSVVVAVHNAASVIGGCLEALLAGAEGLPVEIVVVDSSTDGTADLVRRRFPGVRLAHFPEPLGIPQLRGHGAAQANGDIVAFLDPYCIVDPEWVRRTFEVHRDRPEGAIGGAVELDAESRPTLGNWATYLSEYAPFMPPLAEGGARELVGSNIVYKRWALDSAGTPWEQGFWKTFLNMKLLADGHHLWATPRLLVKLRKPVPLTEFARSRYDHGRCFAGMRVAGTGPTSRALRALTTPALPVVAFWRRWRAFWPKRRFRSRFLAAIPLLLAFDVSWAWGELAGYVLGPKRTCQRLFY